MMSRMNRMYRMLALLLVLVVDSHRVRVWVFWVWRKLARMLIMIIHIMIQTAS